MKIFQVDQVAVYITDSGELLILALGKTSTTGWTNPRLDNSSDPKPEDAVYEFSFDADPPKGISLPVLTPIAASHSFKPPKPPQAVIVRARTNYIVVHLSEFIPFPKTQDQIRMLTSNIGVHGEEVVPTGLLADIDTTTRQAEGDPTTTWTEGPVTTLRLCEETPPTSRICDDPKSDGGYPHQTFGRF